ncbi:membrane associated protein [Streptomyces sp. SPB074]|nr:membrane associated protein [Streptomyces sp. SPB074]
MSLLTNVMDHSLDDGYAEAAARKRAAGGAAGLPRTLRGRLLLGLGLVLAALVVTVGASQARESAPVLAKEREELIDRINDESDSADRLEKHVESLRDEVGRRQDAALKDNGTDRVRLLGLLSGASAAQGPGVRLVVDDAASAQSSTGDGPRQTTDFSDIGRVRDRDLQRVVNGLWESGAEAVAVNGQRLTALSAIRAAGEAVLVDNKPLAPPYTVLALGDGARLKQRFQRSVDGAYLNRLHEDYDIRVKLSAEDSLRVPAATAVRVRSARPETGAGSPAEQGPGEQPKTQSKTANPAGKGTS